LREGVKFHSGDEMTADDIVFVVERMIAKNASFRSQMTGFKSVEALDPRRVRIRFDKPNIEVLYNRTIYVFSKKHFERVGEEEFARAPMGTGPYRWVNYVHGRYIDIERFEDYWDTKPTPKKIRASFVAEANTRIAQLRAGEVDMVQGVPYQEVDALRKAGFNLTMNENAPAPSLVFQNWNPKAPWADRRVRKAIAHAIDVDAMLKQLFHGIPQRLAILTEGEVGYDPSLKPYNYDPALSKRLLAEAGFANGFKMEIDSWGNAPATRETSEAVALFLRQVGINCTVVPVQIPTALEKIAKRGRDPSFLYAAIRTIPISNFRDPASGLNRTFSTHSPFSFYKPEDPEAFDALIAKASGTPDDGKRGEIIKQISKILYDDYAYICLMNTYNIVGMRKNIQFKPIKHFLNLMHFRDITVDA